MKYKKFISWIYMTEQEAKSVGFTHHGAYFGIPVYLGISDVASFDDGMVVAAKFPWMEPLMTLWHHVEQTLRNFAGMEPEFQFLVKGEIQ